MPELPEVETIRSQLHFGLTGRQIAAITVLSASSFQAVGVPVGDLVGERVLGVRRRGKVLLIELSGGWVVLVHLKMTGQLLFFDSGGSRTRQTRVVWEFAGGGALVFNDQRRFGWMRVVPAGEVADEALLARMGPEPLGEGFGADVLRGRLERHPRQMIKATLLDQSVVAGIGNIYADEVLWGARIHPMSPVGVLSAVQVDELASVVVEVLERSILLGGSSMRDYVDASGERGAYLDQAAVFGREGEPCGRCEEAIVKIRVAGRGTHLCPNCQELAGP